MVEALLRTIRRCCHVVWDSGVVGDPMPSWRAGWMLRVLVDFFKVLPKQAFVNECYPAVFQIPWAGVARSSGTTTLMPLSLVCDPTPTLIHEFIRSPRNVRIKPLDNRKEQDLNIVRWFLRGQEDGTAWDNSTFRKRSSELDKVHITGLSESVMITVRIPETTPAPTGYKAWEAYLKQLCTNWKLPPEFSRGLVLGHPALPVLMGKDRYLVLG